MAYGTGQLLCRAWNVSVQSRYFRLRGAVYRGVQMVLLVFIVGFLIGSQDKSNNVTFLMGMGCLVLITALLIFLANILFGNVPQNQDQLRPRCYHLPSIMEAVHDSLSCLALLTGAVLILVSHSPGTYTAVAAVLTVVVVVVLALQCVENLQRGLQVHLFSHQQAEQGEEEERVPMRDVHVLPRRRYASNTRQGRSAEWLRQRRLNQPPAIPLVHMSPPRRDSPSLSTPSSSPLLHSPRSPRSPLTPAFSPGTRHTRRVHPSSGLPLSQDVASGRFVSMDLRSQSPQTSRSHPQSLPSTSRFPTDAQTHSGASRTQDVALNGNLTRTQLNNSDTATDSNTPPVYPSHPIPHTSLHSQIPTTLPVSLNPVYSNPLPAPPAAAASTASLDNLSVYENVPPPTTRSSPPDLTVNEPIYVNFQPPTTTTAATIPSEDSHSTDDYAVPVSYL